MSTIQRKSSANFPDQLSGWHFQCPGNFQDVQKREVPTTALDLGDVIPVQVRKFSQVLLAQLSAHSQHAHSRSELKESISHSPIVSGMLTISPYTIVCITIVW